MGNTARDLKSAVTVAHFLNNQRLRPILIYFGFFQVVFVATAMSVVSGAVAERMKLWSFLVFSAILTAFIYPMEGYWTWGGGFLAEAGFSDFAGSGIVHMAGASAALAGVLLLGARKGMFEPEIYPIPGSNMPLATLGTFILWFGWFGGITLMDTPGVLWPNVENPNSGMRLAVIGSVKDTAMDYGDVAFFAYAACYKSENTNNVS